MAADENGDNPMRAAFTRSAGSPAPGPYACGAPTDRPVRPGATPPGTLWTAIAAALLAAAVLALPTAPASAAPSEPAQVGAPVAIMGLSLAMTAPQVMNVLRPQVLRLSRHTHPCPAAPAARCTDLILAHTPDGALMIRFADTQPGDPSGPALAWRIRLTIRGAGLTAPARPARQLWCLGVAPGAPCPPGRPRLRLIRRPDGTSILSLSDPGLRDRLARASAAAMRSAGARPPHAPPPAG